MSGDRLRKAKNKRMMRLLPAAVVVASVAVWLIVPGKEEVKRYVPNVGNGYTTPTMATTHVSTLISDSGYTRYHMETPLWQMFEDADEPFWKFPEGIELEQYDLDMHPESTVVCDSAIYYSRKRIWQLDGNVVMVNTDADSFLTQQLFWDQNARKIYSDSFIHIVRTDRVIEGYGFESDQSMKYYSVNRPTAILPADMRPGARKRPDSLSADTASPARPASAPRRPTPDRKPRKAASDAVPVRDVAPASDAPARMEPKKATAPSRVPMKAMPMKQTTTK